MDRLSERYCGFSVREDRRPGRTVNRDEFIYHGINPLHTHRISINSFPPDGTRPREDADRPSSCLSACLCWGSGWLCCREWAGQTAIGLDWALGSLEWNRILLFSLRGIEHVLHKHQQILQKLAVMVPHVFRKVLNLNGVDYNNSFRGDTDSCCSGKNVVHTYQYKKNIVRFCTLGKGISLKLSAKYRTTNCNYLWTNCDLLSHHFYTML